MEKPQTSKFYRIADMTVQVKSGYPISQGTFHPKFSGFEVAGKSKDNIRIHHHFQPPGGETMGKNRGTQIYQKDQWQIFKSDEGWVYYYTSLFPDDVVGSAVGLMDKDYSDIHIYVEDITPEIYAKAGFQALTLFNTDQMIFTKLLSDRNGLVAHANGFNVNGNGLLFAGVSGSGKSTLSRMLKQAGHEILCDDRMFIRRKGGQFRIFGNWCYGSHPDVSASQAPLTGIMFLKKGSCNRIVRLTQTKEVVSRLMAVVVKPLLDVEGWGKYLATLDELQKSVHFYEVEFDLSGKISQVIDAQFRN